MVQDILFSLENRDFRIFLEYVNPAANILPSRNYDTIKARAVALFDEGKKCVGHILQSPQSAVNLPPNSRYTARDATHFSRCK